MRQKVPVPIKLAFGFGEFGLSLSANFLIFYLLVFLTQAAGLPSSWAGFVLLIGKVVDAVTDPMVGSISDSIKTRWGRRLPFMAVGAPVLAFAFLGQMWVPGFSPVALFIYYVVIGIVSQTFYSIVTIPYTSLTAEMTQDYEERTSLNSFRQVFSMAGSIAALVIAKIVFANIPDDVQLQFLVMGAVGGGVILASVWASFLGIKKYVLEREQFRLANAAAMAEQGAVVHMSLPQQIKVAFSNRAFLILCMLYLFGWMAVQVTVTVLTFYLEFWMRVPKADAPNVILAVIVTALLMLGPWALVSHRVGKKKTFIFGAFIWLGAQCMLVGIQPGQTVLLYSAAVLAGFGVSVCYLVPWAMLPDVIELDELETGQRREGIFFGLLVFLQKLAVAVAIFLVGIVLDVVKFVEKVPEGVRVEDFTQPQSALNALRLLVGPLPMFFLVLAIVAAYMFPITKEKHAEALEELKRRRGERNGNGTSPDDVPPPDATSSAPL